MEFSIIKSFVENIKNNGEFGTKATLVTIPTWKSTTDNPYVITRKEGRKVVERIERVRKIAIYNNDIMFGGRYVKMVGTRIENVGGNKEEWEEKPMSGCSWENYPFLMHSNKDNNVKYLRISMRKNCKPQVFYVLDGELVTDKRTLADIESRLRPHYASEKQIAFGVAEEDVVRPLNVRVENILSLTQGKQTIVDEELSTRLATIMAETMAMSEC